MTKLITDAVIELNERIVDKNLLVRRVNIGANHVISESEIQGQPEQLNLFTNFEALKEAAKEYAAPEKERKI